MTKQPNETTFLIDQRKPSIAMAAVCFERNFLSRARSAAFGRQQTLDRKFLSKLFAAIAIDGVLRRGMV